MPNLDEIAKLITEKWELLAAITVIVFGTGGITGLFKWLQNRQRRKRIRQLPAGDFPFEVIKPHSPDLLKQIMGGNEQNPLADYKIPYQERQPDRNVRQELEAAFAEKNWVLILGKSGLGKTREAAHLAEVLNQEGWTVLKLADQSGEWLDEPKEFPSEINPNDRLLFFLDDLNRWMYAGNPHEIHPKAGEELARPLREPVQERLPRLLQYFENQCKSPYVRVIATARDEREPDKIGELSPWEKLQWEKYQSFWQQFHGYSLREPSEDAIVRLLTDCVAAADMKGVDAEYGQIARRNDGTFRNITLNLDSAQNRGLAVNNQEFSPKLDETWRRRYNKVVQRYPLAKYVYDAVELLRTLNLRLTAPMLAATTKLLLPGRGLRRWWQGWQLRSVLRYLVTTEQILMPKDGQIEAKKTVSVDVGCYLPAILRLLAQIAKQDPTYPVAAECFDCGVSLSALGRKEEAIASYDKAIAFKPDLHEAWINRGVALSDLGRTQEEIVSYEKAIEIKPDTSEAWYNRGKALFTLGGNLKAQGQQEAALTKFSEGLTSFDKVIEIKPDDDKAWYIRSLSLSALRRWEDAIKSYDRVIAFKPNDHEAWYSPWFDRGMALFTLRRWEDAIKSLDKAVEFKPDDDKAWYIRGLALSILGCGEKGVTRFCEAIASYDKALEIQPGNHKVLYYRGMALFALGCGEEGVTRFCEAIASYDKALEIKPGYYEAWNNRGLALSNLGRYEEAIASYDHALEVKPDKHEAWYNKACCYGLQKNVDLAIETLQHAITLNSKYQDMAKTDSDFDGIRDDERFQAVIGE